MKEFFYHNKKGFISTYFLAILLYVSSLITIVTLIEREDIQTFMNMKEANTYLQEEITILNDIKCKLLNDALEDTYYSIGEVEYSCSIEETIVYIDTDKEQMIVSYDPTTKRILDYETIRG